MNTNLHGPTSIGTPTDLSRYRNPDDDPRGPYLLADITAPGTRPHLQFLWKNHLPPPDRHWAFTLERAEALDAGGQIVWPTGGARPRLKRYLADLQKINDDKSDQETSPGDPCEPAVLSMLSALARQIAKSPDYLWRVEWRDLERVLGEVVSALGFEVLVTRPGRDGGFDLELRHTEAGVTSTYLVEIKHWKPPARPGPGILERFFEVVIAKQAARGLMLSSSGFSQPLLTGRSELSRQQVRLGDENKIVSLCQTYVSRKEGVWFPKQSLPTLLFADTY